jgi:acyl-CoA thioester hydrolase
MSRTRITPHLFPVRIYYEDTDAGGIVYHANYLKFFERARTEYMRDWGFDQSAVKREFGLIFAVRNCSIEYLRPARLDDRLLVSSELVHLGGSRLDIRQWIRHEVQEDSQSVLCRAMLTIVAVGAEGKAVKIPAPLRTVITPLLAPKIVDE